MTLSNEEQLLIELINRARLDPAGEAARFGIGLNDGIAALPGTASSIVLTPEPMQPLAANALLHDAADKHTQWMLDNGLFVHVRPDGNTPGDRMEAEGFAQQPFFGWAENIAVTSTTDPAAAIPEQNRALFLSASHRVNTLDPDFREIGVGQRIGTFTDANGTVFGQGAGFSITGSMVTENFAVRNDVRFVTGVVYDDLDGDGFYSIGEGRAGAEFAVADGQTFAGATGGYALATAIGGEVALTIDTGTHQGTARTDLSGGNVKIDIATGGNFFDNGQPALLSSADLTLLEGFVNAGLLGVAGLTLEGNPLANVLRGNAGANRIEGGAGDDTMDGGAGDDTLVGGAGSDNINGGAGIDTVVFDFNRSAASIGVQFASGEGEIITVTHSASGTTDWVLGAELFAFADGTIDVADLTAGPPPGAGETITGTPDHDVLTGTAGNDSITGGTGNDTINPGDGADTVIGGDGDDLIFGGASAADLRDNIFGGAGNDTIDGGHGNDEVRGDAGNDVLRGGFGVDSLFGGAGDDNINGGAFSDLVFGGAGDDFVNGGFGFDRINGGAGADTFFHLGIADHGSDWIQDFAHAEGDVLLFGQAGATGADFQVNIATTQGAGDAGVDEAFVIYKPTGQIVWALVDGAGNASLNLSVTGSDGVFDLLA